MAREKLDTILKNHAMWLKTGGGKQADLSGANLIRANLSGADLREANLRDANLSGANLSGADPSGADLSRAYLREANLREANLRETNLRETNLSGADLSRATGLLQAADYMAAYFERTDIGYIAYKTFNSQYSPPERWEIAPGAVITENVNFDRCTSCGCGINVAPLEWVKRNYTVNQIWKVLIRWEWLCGVCVPYNTDGKIRCERVEILGVV